MCGWAVPNRTGLGPDRVRLLSRLGVVTTPRAGVVGGRPDSAGLRPIGVYNMSERPRGKDSDGLRWTETRGRHNHGYPAVDPLKPAVDSAMMGNRYKSTI